MSSIQQSQITLFPTKAVKSINMWSYIKDEKLTHMHTKDYDRP